MTTDDRLRYVRAQLAHAWHALNAAQAVEEPETRATLTFQVLEGLVRAMERLTDEVTDAR